MKKKDKEVIYLLPTVLNGKGKAMEYRIVIAKLDKRTRFYKNNKDSIIHGDILAVIKEESLVKNDRIIMRSGEEAVRVRSLLNRLERTCSSATRYSYDGISI